MKMLVFGHGYTSGFLTPLLRARGWRVLGTTRGDPGRVARAGAEPVLWPGEEDRLRTEILAADAILVSVAPGPSGDPVLAEFADGLAQARPRWLGYLSTTGVYGDRGGGWVTEDSALDATGPRGQARIRAERDWRDLASRVGLPLHIFRLAGIYGPGRGPFEKVRNGTARRIVKPGQVFSRIHAEDAARVLLASIDRPSPGTAYNLCDDDPAPPQDVLAHAAELLGLPPPPEGAFEKARMTPMARSFYDDNKRVSNRRIKEDLGVRLLYPDYRSGLAAILAAEAGGGRSPHGLPAAPVQDRGHE